MTWLILGGIVYLVGTVLVYGLCHALFGEPNGRVRKWWRNDRYGEIPGTFYVPALWPFCIWFILIRYGAEKAREFVTRPKPQRIEQPSQYKIGDWKAR